jgi:hypothetical protein
MNKEQQQQVVSPQVVSQQEQVQEYLCGMSPLERQGYEIARSHLNSSFNIVKSNGFILWLGKRS